jgi:SAM-dependent methyltransferase
MIDGDGCSATQINITEKASIARMYDFILGGTRNFPVDRDAARQAMAQMPDLARILRANRAFLGRAVRSMQALGIRQFLDLGSGIPGVGNVHDIAQRVDPGARVVYVDNDPVAVLAADESLVGNPNATMIHADLRQVDAVLGDPEVTRLLEHTAPVGVLLVGVLYLVAASPCRTWPRRSGRPRPG